MKSSIQFLLALLLGLVTTSLAFQGTLPQMSQRSMQSFMSEDATAADETAEEEPPKPQVACPDCDLCDGSGR